MAGRSQPRARRPRRSPLVSFETVAALIWDRPGDFADRTSALHHLLCAPDNGYEWVRGSLLAVAPRPRAALHEGFLSPAQWAMREGQVAGDGSGQRARREHQQMLVRRRVRHRVLAATPADLTWVHPRALGDPSSWVPTDASVDWVAAAHELAAAVRAFTARQGRPLGLAPRAAVHDDVVDADAGAPQRASGRGDVSAAAATLSP